MAIKTENLAIIMTDIVDFTKITVHQSRSENEQLLATHNNILIPILRHYSGRHVKSIGDALLIVFRSPTDAMLCAMAMQDALFEHNQKNESQAIHIRIGASLGEVRVTRNDIFGEPVNLTSRVEGITPADEIYLTEALYMAMNKAEVPAEEVGFKEIRGLKEPIRLYSIPRFSETRLVPQELSTQDLEGIAFPYGGAHLSFSEELKNSKFKVPPNLLNVGATHRAKLIWLAPALIAAGILFWLGANYDSDKSENDGPSISTAKPDSTNSANEEPAAGANKEPSANDNREPSAKDNREASENVSGETSTENQLTAASMAGNGELKPELDSAVETNKTINNQAAAATSSDSPPVTQPSKPVTSDVQKPEATVTKPKVVKPKFSWNVRIAKSEYRAHRIDKAKYRKIIYDLKVALKKNINREKVRYRAREISKAEYKKRVRKLEADYRG